MNTDNKRHNETVSLTWHLIPVGNKDNMKTIYYVEKIRSNHRKTKSLLND